MLIRGNGRRLAVIFKAALPRSVHDGSYTLLHSGHLGATRHKFYRSRVTTDFRFIPRSHRHINSRTNSGVGLPTRVDSVYILVMGWCLFFKSVRYLLSVFTKYRDIGSVFSVFHFASKRHVRILKFCFSTQILTEGPCPRSRRCQKLAIH